MLNYINPASHIECQKERDFVLAKDLINAVGKDADSAMIYRSFNQLDFDFDLINENKRKSYILCSICMC